MQFGVSFPRDHTVTDPGAVRELAQAAEEMGFDFLTTGDHVLGVDPAQHPGWTGPYTYRDVWREPLVFLGYLAACTRRIRLATSILILPQRQTALVAKQAAEVDVLSGGRLRLGIGIGWNAVEYEALNQDFRNRGQRTEEQIAVLRALWTQEVVTFQGQWHRIIAAGINPLPVQRPIPIWMGGEAEPALKRIARLADGWIPETRSPSSIGPVLDRFRAYARQAGRNPSDILIVARMFLGTGTAADWGKTCAAWEAVGATHMLVSTNNAGCTSVGEHVALLRKFRNDVG